MPANNADGHRKTLSAKHQSPKVALWKRGERQLAQNFSLSEIFHVIGKPFNSTKFEG